MRYTVFRVVMTSCLRVIWLEDKVDATVTYKIEAFFVPAVLKT